MNIIRTIFDPFKVAFLRFDKKVDGGITFFIKHYGKSRFMIAMSKKGAVFGAREVVE